MSSYGKLWEEIRGVRVQLAGLLGVPVSEIPKLADIRTRLMPKLQAENRLRAQIDSLLVRWTELEAEAASLDSHTGESR